MMVEQAPQDCIGCEVEVGPQGARVEVERLGRREYGRTRS